MLATFARAISATSAHIDVRISSSGRSSSPSAISLKIPSSARSPAPWTWRLNVSVLAGAMPMNIRQPLFPALFRRENCFRYYVLLGGLLLGGHRHGTRALDPLLQLLASRAGLVDDMGQKGVHRQGKIVFLLDI